MRYPTSIDHIPDIWIIFSFLIHFSTVVVSIRLRQLFPSLSQRPKSGDLCLPPATRTLSNEMEYYSVFHLLQTALYPADIHPRCQRRGLIPIQFALRKQRRKSKYHSNLSESFLFLHFSTFMTSASFNSGINDTSSKTSVLKCFKTIFSILGVSATCRIIIFCSTLRLDLAPLVAVCNEEIAAPFIVSRSIFLSLNKWRAFLNSLQTVLSLLSVMFFQHYLLNVSLLYPVLILFLIKLSHSSLTRSNCSFQELFLIDRALSTSRPLNHWIVNHVCYKSW